MSSTLDRHGVGSSKKKKGLSMEEKVIKVEEWFKAHAQPYTLKELQSAIPKATGVLYQSIEECLELLVAEQRVEQDRVGVHTLFWLFPRTPKQVQQDTEAQHARTTRTCAAQRHGALTHAQRSSFSNSNNNNNNNNNYYSNRMIGSQVGQLDARARRSRVLLETHSGIASLQELQSERVCELAALESDLAAMQAQQHAEHATRADTEAEWAALTRTRDTLQRTLRSEWAVYDRTLMQQLRRATAVAAAAARRWAENYELVEQHLVSALGLRATEVRRALQIPSEVDEGQSCETEEPDDDIDLDKDNEEDERMAEDSSASAAHAQTVITDAAEAYVARQKDTASSPMLVRASQLTKSPVAGATRRPGPTQSLSCALSDAVVMRIDTAAESTSQATYHECEEEDKLAAAAPARDGNADDAGIVTPGATAAAARVVKNDEGTGSTDKHDRKNSRSKSVDSCRGAKAPCNSLDEDDCVEVLPAGRASESTRAHASVSSSASRKKRRRR